MPKPKQTCIQAGRAPLEFAKAAAPALRKESPAATHALIGPALIYHDDQLSVFVILGRQGRAGKMIGLDLGKYECDPTDDPFAAHFDTVLWVREPGGITKHEGDELQRLLVAELGRSLTVQTFADDGALVAANARLFPSTKARALAAQVLAKASST